MRPRAGSILTQVIGQTLVTRGHSVGGVTAAGAGGHLGTAVVTGRQAGVVVGSGSDTLWLGRYYGCWWWVGGGHGDRDGRW